MSDPVDQQGSADRAPTEEEEAAAESLADLDPSVAENFERQNKVGAEVRGEGEIS